MDVPKPGRESQLRQRATSGILRNPSTGLPSVESLLASTAKLLSQASALDRSHSKLSSLSHPTSIGSQDLAEKFSHHSFSLERLPTRAGSGVFQPARLSGIPAAPLPEGTGIPQPLSQQGSPLIRASRSHDFQPEDADELEQQATRPQVRGSRELRKQLKKLKSSISSLRDSISPQAVGRSEVSTRIPQPRPLVPAPEHPRPGADTPRDTVRVPDFESGAEEAVILHGPANPKAFGRKAAPKPLDEELPSSASPVGQITSTGRKDGQAHKNTAVGKGGDPAPAVSSLFESLWDTDDECNKSSTTQVEGNASCREVSAQPVPGCIDDVWIKIVKADPGQPDAAAPSNSTHSETKIPTQVPRSKGAHKKSAESGTLHRKMRGLEDAWQLLEKSHSGRSSAAAVSLPSCGRGDGSSAFGPASTSGETAGLSPRPARSAAEARGKAQGSLGRKEATARAAEQAVVAPHMPARGVSGTNADWQQPPQTALSKQHAPAASLGNKAKNSKQGGGAAGTGQTQAVQPGERSKAGGSQLGRGSQADGQALPYQTTGLAVGGAEEVRSMRAPNLSIRLPLPEAKPSKSSRLMFWKSSKPPRGAPEVRRAQAVVEVGRGGMQSGSTSADSSPERPVGRKDSLGKLTGLFRRRSCTSAAARPAAPSSPGRAVAAAALPSTRPPEASSGQLGATLGPVASRAGNSTAGINRRNAPCGYGQSLPHSASSILPVTLKEEKTAARAGRGAETGTPGNETMPAAADILDGKDGAAAAETAAGVDSTEPSADWLSPEKAVKNLLVPTWVPNKLPLSCPAPADEPQRGDSLEGHQVQQDLIAAVSSKQDAPLRSPGRPEWSPTKVPFSDVALPGAAPPMSTNRSLPAMVPEDEDGCDPGTPCRMTAVGKTVAEPRGPLVPAATLPIQKSAESLREGWMATTPSLPLLQEQLAPAISRPQGSAQPKAKEGFFRSLFRRRSESSKRERGQPAAGNAPPASRRITDGGALPALSLSQLPPAIHLTPLSARAPPRAPALPILGGDPSVSAAAGNRPEGVREAQAGSLASRAGSWEEEFSFHIPATAAPRLPADRSRTPSTGRRRITDEDLDNLQRSFKNLEETYDKLPERAPPRERQNSNARPRPSNLPQMEIFERAAGNVRPRPLSATGTAETVPFIMRKLPSPVSEEHTSPVRSFRQPGVLQFEPASLTTSRWMESLRSPVPRRLPSNAAGQVTAADSQDKPCQQASEPTACQDSKRAVSPFGRVRCEENRAVPFCSSPSLREDTGEQGAEPAVPQGHLAEPGKVSAIARIEQHLKQSAGAGEGRQSPQWRQIAERVVKGTEVSAEGTRGRLDAGVPVQPAKPGHLELPVCHLVSESSPGPGASGRSSPVVVDSSRPAFPALKAYLRAKSPRRTVQKELTADPEIAACHGVSALQRRFEAGLLLEGNVAALQRQFDDPGHSRERTAAWANQHAVKVEPGKTGASLFHVRASTGPGAAV